MYSYINFCRMRVPGRGLALHEVIFISLLGFGAAYYTLQPMRVDTKKQKELNATETDNNVTTKT